MDSVTKQFGSAVGPCGNKPLPEPLLTQIYVAILAMMSEYIQIETKWPSFCWQYFKINFLDLKLSYSVSIGDCFQVSIRQ